MNKKKIASIVASVLLMYMFFFLPVPYFIERPGSAVSIGPMVEVEGSDGESNGELKLTTIELFKATPFTSLFQFLPHHSGVAESQLLGQFEDYSEYRALQRYHMENSINMAKAAAFKEADLPYEIDYRGVFVMSVSPESNFSDLLEMGDGIREVNGQSVLNTEEFIELISNKSVGETISLTVERNSEEFVVEESLTLLEETNQPGVGISLVTRSSVETSPSVTIRSGNIGGPSAGLLFALEVYSQITSKPVNDLKIAGTGTINDLGEVGRVGGVDKKVVAADREGVDIFFVPDDIIEDDLLLSYPAIQSNYQTAVETAESIDTHMEIVAVNYFSEAVSYLDNLNR